MNINRILPLVTLSFAVLLTACGGGYADQSTQYSNSGEIPESYLPSDVAMVLSYSNRDDGQFEAAKKLGEAMGSEETMSETAADAFNSEFSEWGVDFETDLKPALGDQFRMVYAMSMGANEEPETFAVLTLADASKMSEVLQTLSASGKLTYKKLSDGDAYTNTEASSYFMVYEDLLLVASTPESLQTMTSQSEEESLWGSDEYRSDLDQVGSDYLVYGMLYPKKAIGEDLPSVGALSSSVSSETLVVRAEEDGLRFDAWVKVNEEEAKAAGLTMDMVPREAPYLFEEIPAAGLIGYTESYGLKQSFDKAIELTEGGEETAMLDQINEVTRAYLSMDFEDILAFMNKGYAMAIHQDEDNIVPGLTFYVDVSSDIDSATDFINKLDGQLSGVLVMLQQLLPDAVSKDTVDWGDATFSRLKVDLSALPQSEEAPLPEKIMTSVLQIVYGVQDDRLIISTATDWDMSNTIQNSEFYKKLSAHRGEGNEGLILLNVQELAGYIGSIMALQSELGSDTQEQAQGFLDFMNHFTGFVAQSETDKYESHFSGFLMLAQ